MQAREDETRQDPEAASGNAPDPGEAWMRHMRRGEWEQAWRLSDRQLALRADESCAHWPRHLQYVWTGAALTGKRVLMRCYHGLGDTIQFVRYAPVLKAIAREVILWAQPGLIPLLSGVAGIDRLIPLHDGAPQADFDVDVEIMELPHIFRTTLATVPARIPYLLAEPMPLPPSSDRRPKIGLVWKAGDWAEQRSIPFRQLAPFAALTDVQLFILQPGAAAAGWSGEFGTFLGEFDLPRYARALRSMDMLISIDSMPAHLAGALGVPVWTLLHTEADWRWMEDRQDSPWYPGMRLFRQRRSGDWETVIEEVASALAVLSRTKGS
jgi:hypothetical protein